MNSDYISEKTYIQLGKVELLIPLRHAVLRQGLPIEAASFSHDNDPDTYHFACFVPKEENGDGLIGCVSYIHTCWNNEPAYQLRGMAIHPDFQSQNIGRELVEFAQKIIIDQTAIRLFWCNARLSAIGFYEKMGWTVTSDIFDIGDIPHRTMTVLL